MPNDQSVIGDLFTSAPLDLFRLGNASGPKLALENIRPRDVNIKQVEFDGGKAVNMVDPVGGLSTFDAINPGLKGTKWWRIPKGTQMPDTIRVVKDRTDPKTGITHYSLRPARLMTLLEYAEGLKELSKSAEKCFVGQGEDHETKTGSR